MNSRFIVTHHIDHGSDRQHELGDSMVDSEVVQAAESDRESSGSTNFYDLLTESSTNEVESTITLVFTAVNVESNPNSLIFRAVMTHDH